MALFQFLVPVWQWFKKVFVDHTKSGATVAVAITETIKAILNNPVAGFLENVIDAVTHTQLAANIAAAVNALIPKILTVELGIEGLPDNPTPDQILAFEQSIMKAFGVTSSTSKLYTTLAAQIYGIIQTTLSTTPGTFANWVSAVEQAYQDYQADLQNTAATDVGTVNAPVGTVLPNGNEVLPN